MSGHTKGPWRGESDDFVTGVSDSTGNTIAEVNIESLIEFDPDVHDITEEEGRANAHLIVAAPNLLEALKEITNAFNLTRLVMDKTARDESGELVEAARAAIAKAEGNL